MGHIPGLFKVSQVKVNLIPYFNALNVIRCQMATDHSHVHMHLIAIPFHFCVLFLFSRIRVLIFLQVISLFTINDIPWNSLGIVWLSLGWEIGQDLDFITGNIIELGRVG